MDRVNRTLLFASLLLAIPMVLLGTPISMAQSSAEQHAVRHAVGGTDDAHQPVKQVAARQPSEPQTKPGLLQVLIGKSNKASENHKHQNMSNSSSKGLLDSLFSRSNSQVKSSGPSKNSQATHRKPQGASKPSVTPTTSASNEADWNGVPHHDAVTTNRSSTPLPLRDPNPAALAAQESEPRVIRGGTVRTVPVTTASVRRPAATAGSDEGDSAIPVPMPPREETSTNTTGNEGDANISRRRTDRRSVSSMSTTSQAAPTSTKSQSVVDDQAVVDLVPKVTRKPLTSDAPKTAIAPIDAPPSRDSQEGDQPWSAVELESPITAAELTPPGADEISTEQQRSVAPQSTEATLSVELETKPVSTTLRSASSGTPASIASHRSGPPNQAFQPAEMTTLQGPAVDNDASATESSQPEISVASRPVGSGVAPQQRVDAPYRKPSPPSFEVATNPAQSSDPYGQRAPVESLDQSWSGSAPLNDSGDHGQDTNVTPDTSQTSRGASANATTANPTSTSELPGIRVTTNGPGAIMIRQTNQYEIRIENRGAIDATGVMVRALIPDWAEVRGHNATRGSIENQGNGSIERLVWSIDQLSAGESETMVVRLMAARSGTYDLDVDWTLLPQKSTARVQVREPRLDLTIEGPEEVVFGHSQTYKVRVLNPGDGTAANVVFTLSPNSATPQSQRIGDIPPGKEAQFDVELTAQDLGDLKIHGLASGDLELRAEAEKTIRVAAARLEAELSGPEVKYQNTEATYSLQIQNLGTASSERIAATLRLPSGAKYLGGVEDAAQEGSALRWEISSLAPGASRNYQFRCNMSSTGEHLFAFDCKGTAAGNASVSIATKVESIADLVLTVSDPVAPAPIGTDVTYEIVIRNRGSKEATDVRAVAQFSHGIEPMRVEGQSGEVVTGQVLYDAIPRIGPGQEVRLRVVAQAETAGHHRFRTEVHSGDTVLVAEEATHFMSPKSERVSRRSTDATNR